MSNFKWGILSTGGIAKKFCDDLAFLDGHVVAAVGSRSQSTADAFAQDYPGAVAYGSYEALVEADVDAIYVATPHPMHRDNAMLAMRAGKPVLCEKAFTINAEQARELINYSRGNQIPLMEAMWTRFLPHILEIQKVISTGVLGEIHTIIADHGQYIPYSKKARLWEPELGGGALLDLGIYPLTLAHIVMGNPVDLHAHATLTDLGVDLQTSIGIKYANGAHAMLTCTMANKTSVRATIAGELARIEIDGSFYAPASWRLITRDGVITEYPSEYQGLGIREEAIEFARIVRAGEIESPLMPHATSIALMEQMDQIRREIGVKYPGE